MNSTSGSASGMMRLLSVARRPWKAPAGSRTHFGALLLGAHHENELVYVGKVGTGFSDKTLRELHKQLRALEANAVRRAILRQRAHHHGSAAQMRDSLALDQFHHARRIHLGPAGQVVDRADVVPEHGEVRIVLAGDRAPAAAEVQHGRRRVGDA